MKPKKKEFREPDTLADIRRAVADYMYSEGCSCCRGSGHELNRDHLGKLLRVRKYNDGSAYDFFSYRTKAARPRRRDRA